MSKAAAIGYVATGGLGRPRDLHDLTAAEAKVPGDGVLRLDLGQVVLLATTETNVSVEHNLLL